MRGGRGGKTPIEPLIAVVCQLVALAGRDAVGSRKRPNCDTAAVLTVRRVWTKGREKTYNELRVTFVFHKRGVCVGRAVRAMLFCSNERQKYV